MPTTCSCTAAQILNWQPAKAERWGAHETSPSLSRAQDVDTSTSGSEEQLGVSVLWCLSLLSGRSDVPENMLPIYSSPGDRHKSCAEQVYVLVYGGLTLPFRMPRCKTARLTLPPQMQYLQHSETHDVLGYVRSSTSLSEICHTACCQSPSYPVQLSSSALFRLRKGWDNSWRKFSKSVATTAPVGCKGSLAQFLVCFLCRDRSLVRDAPVLNPYILAQQRKNKKTLERWIAPWFSSWLFRVGRFSAHSWNECFGHIMNSVLTRT